MIKSLIDIKDESPEVELRPLTHDDTTLYLNLHMLEKSPEEWQAVLDKGLGKQPQFLIPKQRIESFVPEALPYITEPLILLCGMLTGGNPGRMVMWAYTLVDLARREGRADISTWSQSDYFGWGTPTDEMFQAAWDSQKGGPGTDIDNMLDGPSPWKALYNR